MNIEDESDLITTLILGLHFSTWLVQLILTSLLFPKMNIVDKPDYSKIPLEIQLDDYKHI